MTRYAVVARERRLVSVVRLVVAGPGRPPKIVVPAKGLSEKGRRSCGALLMFFAKFRCPV